MKSRIHAFVSGRVQGIFFRYNTLRIAENLDVKGWVRNLPDGRVEVVAEGEKDKIDKLMEFLKKGPAGARVDNVEVKTEEYTGEFIDFDVRY